MSRFNNSSSGSGAPFADTTALVKGSGDATKQVRLEADGLSAGVTRVITMPDQDVNLGALAGAPFSDATALVKDNTDATKQVRIEASGVATGTTRVWTAPDQDLDLSLVPNAVQLATHQARGWKDPVTAATTAALPTNTRSGNVLTASANGAAPSQDGVTPVVGESLFVKNEATGANNGLYTWTNVGAAGAPWVLTRRTDADTSAKIAAGLIVEVQQGTTLSGKVWRMTNTSAPTLNTTALTFGAVPTDWADITSKPSTFAPSTHATSHESGGSDPITHNNLAGLATGDPHTQYVKKAGDTFTGAVLLNSDASAALNPVSLQQWQSRAWKDPVTAATTGALPANTRSGNVLTASANGALTAQDGITLTAGQDLFVKNEATGANNGLYTVTNAGGAGAAWVLTRRADADTSAKIAAGLIAEIQQGTTLGGKVWRMTNTAAPTLNTTALTFAAVPVDHADLTGLTTGDPHTQYALSDGTRLRGYRGTSAPASPSAGQVWFDTNTTPATLKEYDGSAWQTGLPRYHMIPFSYKGALAIATGVLRIRIPTVIGACTVVEIGATVNTVSSSGSIILDVNKALAASLGTITTLYTTQGNRPTIPVSTRDVVATLPDVTSFAAGDHLLVDIDSAGTGASDLVGYIVLRH